MTALGTAPHRLLRPEAPDLAGDSVRRILALTRGILAADVPEEAVAQVLRADRVPVCWACHESYFSPAAPHCAVHGR
ncbi:hypothetical protein [Amycolatopsis sp. CA-128772]|uniref:hypothetical protein n=1 Tax=Amycolatopsis sp. CA-128772 TaxID=2073159 RepID=UPI000CD01F2F|nr:hypothetical protein [Amycolatopsis sp. CA-128772]